MNSNKSYFRKEISSDGNTRYYNEKGQLHRENGPAVEYINGTKYWYKNGLPHREDGPAVEYINGNKFWCKNGIFHREDGPAVEYINGRKFWYLDGVIIGYNESIPDGYTQKDFEKYKLDHNIE